MAQPHLNLCRVQSRKVPLQLPTNSTVTTRTLITRTPTIRTKSRSRACRHSHATQPHRRDGHNRPSLQPTGTSLHRRAGCSANSNPRVRLQVLCTSHHLCKLLRHPLPIPQTSMPPRAKDQQHRCPGRPCPQHPVAGPHSILSPPPAAHHLPQQQQQHQGLLRSKQHPLGQFQEPR